MISELTAADEGVNDCSLEAIKVLLALIVTGAWSAKSAMSVKAIAEASGVDGVTVSAHVADLATCSFVVLPVMGLGDDQRYRDYYIETEHDRIDTAAGMMRADADGKLARSAYYKGLAEKMAQGKVPWATPE